MSIPHLPLSRTLCLVVCVTLAVGLVVLSPTAACAQDEPSQKAEKLDAPANRLLLPYYKVDKNNPSGASTLWALRNESLVEQTVTVEYYEADSPQAPQATTELVLAGKQLVSGNIRDVPNLEVDPDGFARGYVIFTAQGSPGDLYGDYLIVTSDQDYAEGSLLLDATEGVDTDLCNLFSMRFLQGLAFGATTEVILWVEADLAPLPPGTVTYAVYDADGGEPVASGTLFLDVVTTRFDVTDLVPENLVGGGLEIQFSQGVRGHVALAMAATGRYSVGFDAVCKG